MYLVAPIDARLPLIAGPIETRDNGPTGGLDFNTSCPSPAFYILEGPTVRLFIVDWLIGPRVVRRLIIYK